MQPTILIFSAFYDPWISGAERFVKETVERLSGRYRFIILTARLSRSVPACEEREGYEIRRLGLGLPLDKWLFPVLAPLAALRINTRVAHAVMESYAGIALWLFGLLKPNVKRVLTLQSGDLDSAKTQARIPGWLWKRIHTNPDQITAISNFLGDRAKRLGADPRRVAIIPNGVDLHRFTPRASSERVPHRIVSVARLSWEKGLSDLLDALALVRRQMSDAHLVLVGDGALRQELEEQVRKLGLQEAVEFRGKLPHEEALALVKTAEIFVCPSLAEGLGIVFLEAQALGVPVIGTSVGGIPDVIEHEATGLLVPPQNSEALASAINQFFSNPERAERMAEQALSRISRFDWARVVLQIADVYERLHQSKRFLIVSGIYPPAAGGPASYARTLSRILFGNGHEITVLTYGDDTTELGQGWHVRTVPRFWPLPLRYLAMLGRVLFHGLRADSLLVLDTVSVGLPATIANWFLRKPLILRVVGDYAWEQGQARFGVHDTLEEFQTKRYGPSIERLRKIQRWVVHRATSIITPSNYLAGIIKQWGVLPPKIHVVRNAVDVTVASQPIIPPTDTRLLLSIARFTPWKGMAELVEAFAIVRKQIPEARLALIGDGPEQPKIEAKIRELGLTDGVELVGRVPHDELPAWYARASGFILNTGYEGMSHQLLEVMSAGLPLATTPAGGNSEIIRDGENGRLFPVNDCDAMVRAMIELLQDRKAVLDRAERGLQDAASWNERQMAQATFAVLLRRGEKPRVLMVTLDQSLVDEGSDTAARMVRYGEETERLDVVILGTGSFGSRQLSSRVRIVRAGGWTKVDAFFRALLATANLARRGQPTVIDCQDPFFTGLVGTLISHLMRVPLLLEVHGDFWNPNPVYAINGLRDQLARLTIPRAEALRMVSERVEKNFLAGFFCSDPDRIVRFPVARVTPSMTNGRTDDRQGVTALFVGRLAFEKGLDAFLPVFADVARQVPVLHLLIVGDGPERAALEMQAKELGIGDRVSFVGFVRDPGRYFIQADFLVLPSRHESWARVAIEAVAYGLPVLMTDVGCAGEVIRNGEQGLVVSVDDPAALRSALTQMATDSHLRERLKAGALRTRDALPTLDQTAKNYGKFWSRGDLPVN